MDDLRAPLVEFTAAAALVDAPGVELGRTLARGIGRLVPRQHVLGHTGKGDAAHDAGRAHEGHVEQILADADCLENLRAAVAVQCADAHFAHDLEQSFVEGLDKVVVRLRLVEEVDAPSFHHHVVDAFVGQVRIDSIGPKAEQRCKMMHLARFAALADKTGAHAQPAADQVMVYRAHRQQRGDGQTVRVRLLIADDDDARVGAHGVLGLGAKTCHRSLERSPDVAIHRFGVGRRPYGVDGGAFKFRFAQPAQLRHVLRL